MNLRCESTLLTVGEIAKRLSQPVHRIEYFIKARRLKPVSWAGNARVFSGADVQLIGAEIARLERDRGVFSD